MNKKLSPKSQAIRLRQDMHLTKLGSTDVRSSNGRFKTTLEQLQHHSTQWQDTVMRCRALFVKGARVHPSQWAGS